MPPFAEPSYPRLVATRPNAPVDPPRRRHPRQAPKAPSQLGPGPTGNRTHDPDGGSGEVHELLMAAVDEAARLLEADGAMVYLLDPATGHLRFAHDAGHPEPPAAANGCARSGSRSGPGCSAAPSRERGGRRHRRLPRRSGVRPRRRPRPRRRATSASARWSSHRSSPATGVRGARHVLRRERRPSARPSSALVRALADHAAAAMANARLIEALDALADGARQRAPTPSGRCARSRPGSAPPRTCLRSCSAPSTRPPGCCRPTAPGST